MHFQSVKMDAYGEQSPNIGRFNVSSFLSSNSGENLHDKSLLELH